jgi:hypothetical protein
MAELFKNDQSLVDEAVRLVLTVGSVERAAVLMKVPPEKLREWIAGHDEATDRCGSR